TSAWAEFEVPYGNVGANVGYAMIANRYLYEHRCEPEQLAKIAVHQRDNACRNPDAFFHGQPITVDDVLASPTISSPLHRLDCCVVTDSGGAVVLTTADRARGCARDPIRILGFGECAATYLVNQMPDLTAPPGAVSAARALRDAGIAPEDVDVAQVYDAFTITALLGLEDLGVCPRGEAGAFVADGTAITVGGALPINTDGGGLSSNHPGQRGIFLLLEATRQLRGESTSQVKDAKLAVAVGNGGQLGSRHATAVTILAAD
ncbi:MAG TPA: hypothetical protein VHI10_11495, partial [Mycobacterium sp.]|nr:hypothetical protein [Mycobacterium sp.]